MSAIPIRTKLRSHLPIIETALYYMSVTLEQLSERATTGDERTERYLVVRLAGQRYGIRQRQVQGLSAWSGMTAMPGMPRFVLGMLKQGKLSVPVIDLRHLFKLAAVPFGPDTAVVLVKSVSDTGHARVLGFMVDAILERRDIRPADVTQPRDLPEIARTKAVAGIATLDDSTLVLLDTDRLTNTGVLQTVDSL